MQVTFDTISIAQPTPVNPAPPPQQRPRVAPAGGRDRSQNNADRGTDFKTALDGALSGQTAQTAVHREESSKAPPRPEKYPTIDAGPVDGAESAELYKLTKVGEAMASRPEFVSAASEYATRFFSIASTYAKPGEKLEVTA